ncbi:MAG: hypothetical protein DRP78_00665 [Candidatus Omnitrophota bacterium]|nr:MAG: hypothetical protein DRP78_00665 [Candidatus Omnitrophota bacterium]
MQSSLFKKNKISVVQIVLIFIAFSLFVFTGVVVKNLVVVKKEVILKRKTLKVIDQGVRNFRPLMRDLDTANKTYNDFTTFFVQQKEFPIFLEILSDLARENEVKIIAMEPGEIDNQQAKFYVQTPIFIDAYSSYHNLGSFVNDIENAEKFMEIKNIKIENNPMDTKKHHIFVSVNTFCLKENEL